MSALQWLEHKGYLSWTVYDPFHRAWNDIRGALKKTQLWRTMLEFTVVCNISYGPFNSGGWHQTLQQNLSCFLRRWIHEAPASGSMLPA